MVKEHINGEMEEFIKGNTHLIENMDMEFIFGKEAEDLRVIGKMARDKVKVNTSLKMANIDKEYGTMIKGLNGQQETS